MITRRIIPCLDCCNGRVLKGICFSNLRDVGSPAELALRYEQEGADEIVLLDIAATVKERKHQLDAVAAVRAAISIPLTAGGGVRTNLDAASLLEAGADKVAVNTAAFLNPQLIAELAEAFGRQCVVLAVDVTRMADSRWQVLIRSGTENTAANALSWIDEAVNLGAGEVLLTSYDRDGTQSGYDTELLRAVSARIGVPLIASGGACQPADFLEALRCGADALLAASVFHNRTLHITFLKKYLKDKGEEVRL